MSSPVTTPRSSRCTVARIAGFVVQKIARRWRRSGGQPRYRHREIVSNVSDEWIEPTPSFLPRLYMSALVARRFNATYPKERIVLDFNSLIHNLAYIFHVHAAIRTIYSVRTTRLLVCVNQSYVYYVAVYLSLFTYLQYQRNEYNIDFLSQK